MTVPGARIVMVGRRRGEVGARGSHGVADVFREDVDLCPDVNQEGVGGPATGQYDGVNWKFVQVHGHGGAGADGVAPNVVGG